MKLNTLTLLTAGLMCASSLVVTAEAAILAICTLLLQPTSPGHYSTKDIYLKEY